MHSAKPRRARRNRTLLHVERLEARHLLSAPVATAAGPNMQITAAFLVDGGNRPISAPAVGQMVYLRAAWTTTDLTSADQYVVRYWVDGVPADSATLTGQSGTRNLTWYRGGWYAGLGAHSVQVTIDGAGAVTETSEADNTLTLNFTPVAPSTLPAKFINPVRGTQGIDWAIVNYADVDPRSGIGSDFRGGPFQYDGHGGIDFTIANFAKMDASAAVVAAASGTVTAAEDGYFDRETAWTGNPYNFVEITHGNGWRTRYLHLAANTLTVRYGDTVAAGQLLGLVGSSGSSTDPHLHFHVYHDDATVETNFDPAAYWATPIPYQGDVPAGIMDSGISNAAVGTDMKERPLEIDLFATSDTRPVWFWIRAAHFNAGDAVQVRWFRPDETVATISNYTAPTILRYDALAWTLPWSSWSAYPGDWEVALTVNGIERARQGFHVTTGVGAPRMKLFQGTTYLIDGRTTELFFGYVDEGDPAVPMLFTAQNHGSAPLSLTGVTLPPGFSLGSVLPTDIPPGGSANFTLRLDGVGAGIKIGQAAVMANDPTEPTLHFNVKGHTFATGRPYVGMTGPAVAFAPGSAPRVLDPLADVADNDSPNFAGGSMTVEMAGFSQATDRLGIRHQGSAAGQIAVSGTSILFGAVEIGTFAGGGGATPLVISFNANATPDAAEVLLRNVTYASDVAFPSPVRRYVRVTLIDDQGKVSYQPVKTIAFDTIAPSALPSAWMNGSRLNVRFEEPVGEPISLATSGADQTITRGGQTLSFGGVDEIVVFGTAGADVLRIDGLDRPMTFRNGNGDDTIAVTGGMYAFAQDLSPALGNVAVEIAAGASATFEATQHLRALNVNGLATLSAGGGKVLRTAALTIGPSSLLDMGDNDLIIDYSSVSPVGVWTGSEYDGVAGFVQSGRLIASIGAKTTLGVAEARDALGITAAQTAAFGDQAVDATSVLVKFTWGGDANLDGRVNIDDYGRIDSMVSQSGSVWGWFNGDFNYDGFINIDDYGIIDSNVAQQGLPD